MNSCWVLYNVSCETRERLSAIAKAEGTQEGILLDRLMEGIYRYLLPYLKQAASEQACRELDRLASKKEEPLIRP